MRAGLFTLSLGLAACGKSSAPAEVATTSAATTTATTTTATTTTPPPIDDTEPRAAPKIPPGVVPMCLGRDLDADPSDWADTPAMLARCTAPDATHEACGSPFRAFVGQHPDGRIAWIDDDVEGHTQARIGKLDDATSPPPVALPDEEVARGRALWTWIGERRREGFAPLTDLVDFTGSIVWSYTGGATKQLVVLGDPLRDWMLLIDEQGASDVALRLVAPDGTTELTLGRVPVMPDTTCDDARRKAGDCDDFLRPSIEDVVLAPDGRILTLTAIVDRSAKRVGVYRVAAWTLPAAYREWKPGARVAPPIAEPTPTPSDPDAAPWGAELAALCKRLVHLDAAPDCATEAPLVATGAGLTRVARLVAKASKDPCMRYDDGPEGPDPSTAYLLLNGAQGWTLMDAPLDAAAPEGYDERKHTVTRYELVEIAGLGNVLVLGLTQTLKMGFRTDTDEVTWLCMDSEAPKCLVVTSASRSVETQFPDEGGPGKDMTLHDWTRKVERVGADLVVGKCKDCDGLAPGTYPLKDLATMEGVTVVGPYLD